ncbi:TonB-dependent receptor [Thermodesulfobacteriota bacterium]
MYRCLLGTAIFLFSFLLLLFGFYQTAVAQSQAEMRILRLFYKEKELVISATRHPKPISQIAENISVITAKEIEDMNAHSVADVLNRIPGLFIVFSQGTNDFGSTSNIHVQGSESFHVLVLVDGIPLNYLSDGHAETNSIPVGIIERIEVIKGPASSAWGSSLGGVINILTKAVGKTDKPAGQIKASFGERNTRDYSAQASGKAGSVGYYLFGGGQETDGLRESRNFDAYHLYSKLSIPLSKNADMDVSVGYSEPNNNFGDFKKNNIRSTGTRRIFFSTASLTATINRNFNMNLSGYTIKQKSILDIDFLTPRQMFRDTITDEQTTGGSGKLIWKQGVHTVVMGLDADRGKLDQSLDAGPLLQLFGTPAAVETQPAISRWAVYVNDTISFDRWSITPGIRYDDNSITSSFVSPSIGVTRRIGDDSIVRASVARGFTIPSLSYTSGGGWNLDSNPALEPEKVWSYQVGFESAAFKNIWVKTAIFYHDLENAFSLQRVPGKTTALVVNSGSIRRKGVECEAETATFYNISIGAGFGLVNIDASDQTAPGDKSSRDRYAFNIRARYEDHDVFQAQLSGSYVWWDLDGDQDAAYDDFIWDVNLSRRLFKTMQFETRLFITAHNLFNGSQYYLGDSKNPGRWIEAGIKITF